MVSGRAMFSARRERIEQVGVLKIKPSSSRRNCESLAVHACYVLAVDAIVPLVALSMVETQLSNVDLPEPEAPMMPTNSPRLTVKLTSLSARVTLPSAPYTFSRCATSSTGPSCAWFAYRVLLAISLRHL